MHRTRTLRARLPFREDRARRYSGPGKGAASSWSPIARSLGLHPWSPGLHPWSPRAPSMEHSPLFFFLSLFSTFFFSKERFDAPASRERLYAPDHLAGGV